LEDFLPILKILWDFLKVWWWVFAPFVLFSSFIGFWQWWRADIFDTTEPQMLLEFRFPQTVEKPLQAMENVFGGFWQIYDPPNTREFWFEGKYQMRLSLELVSTEGTVHFYLRIPKSSIQIIESALYSQFPDAELVEVPDYTKKVPQNIPSKEWKLWGAIFRLDKDNHFPIRTYPSFEPNPDTKEEKRVDPMTVIIEAMSSLGEGEHLWIHFLCTPFGPADKEWPKYVEEGKALIDELVHRTSKNGKPATIPLSEDLRAAAHMVTTGEDTQRQLTGGDQEEQGLLAPELRLTPGERDVVAGVEQKLSKVSFKTYVQFVYFARIEKYFGPAKALPFSYLNQYAHATMNFLRPLKTVKVHTVPLFFLDKRRGYLTRRKIFKSHVWRIPLFPYFDPPHAVLNVEEMASLFHFPSRVTFPSGTIPRVDVKKGEAPPGLPLEE
jgi:hypothetical protein